MATYPILGTLYYKDKNINVKLPIRIKNISLVKYYCPECKSEGTLSQIIRWSEKNLKDLNYETVKQTLGYAIMPTEIIRTKNDVICPICFKEKNKKIRTKINETFLYKLYCGVKPKYLSVGDIISDNIYGRWKKNESYFETSVSCYFNTMKEVKANFNLSNEKIKKGVDVKLEKNKVTAKELNMLYKQYVKKRFIRELGVI